MDARNTDARNTAGRLLFERTSTVEGKIYEDI